MTQLTKVEQPISVASTVLQSVMPQSMAEVIQFAEIASKTNLVPDHFRGKADDCFLAIQGGMELGLGPFQALQGSAIINGRYSLYGDHLIGLVQADRTRCKYIHETFVEETTTAYCETQRVGDPDSYVTKFSKEDAVKARLWGKPGPWADYPKRMLQMRARAFCLRDKYSDILKGIPIAEEQMDITDAVVVETKESSVEDKLAGMVEKPNVEDAVEVEPEKPKRKLTKQQVLAIKFKEDFGVMDADERHKIIQVIVGREVDSSNRLKTEELLHVSTMLDQSRLLGLPEESVGRFLVTCGQEGLSLVDSEAMSNAYSQLTA